MSNVNIKLEETLVEKTIEVVQRLKPYKSYNTATKAVRDALDLVITYFDPEMKKVRDFKFKTAKNKTSGG
jgi:hypothetical protein